jgi:hypothetical protein
MVLLLKFGFKYNAVLKTINMILKRNLKFIYPVLNKFGIIVQFLLRDGEKHMVGLTLAAGFASKYLFHDSLVHANQIVPAMSFHYKFFLHFSEGRRF